MSHLHEELFLEPEQLRLRRDVAHGMKRAASRQSGRHDLEHPHALFAREPGPANEVPFCVLDLGSAGHQQQLFEDLADERVLAEDPEGRGIRADDPAVGVGEDDAVGQRDERFGKRSRGQRNVVAPPAGSAATLDLRLRIVHWTGMVSRTRVP